MRNNPFYPVISVNPDGKTLREVLDEIEASAECMEWEYDEPSNMVNVMDRRIRGSKTWALNRKVSAAGLRREDGLAGILGVARSHGVKMAATERLREEPGTLGEQGLSRSGAMREAQLRSVLNLVLSEAGSPDVVLYTVKALPKGWFFGRKASGEEALRAQVVLQSPDYSGYGDLPGARDSGRK